MATPHWKKKLGGHAGEPYVAAEPSKRGIVNSLLPEDFYDSDIMAGNREGTRLCFIRVKSCHPDRAESFILTEAAENRVSDGDNQFVEFVWLGSPKKQESPGFWISRKSSVGETCTSHSQHGTEDWERRFYPDDLDPGWKKDWTLIEDYLEVEV